MLSGSFSSAKWASLLKLHTPPPRSAEGRLPLGDDRRRLPKQEGKNPSPSCVPLVASVPLLASLR